MYASVASVSNFLRCLLTSKSRRRNSTIRMKVSVLVYIGWMHLRRYAVVFWNIIYCCVYGVTVVRDWIDIWFIKHLHIITTSNYIAFANSHTLQFTTAHTKSSQFVAASPLSSASAFTFWTNFLLFRLLSQGSIELTKILAAISHQPPALLHWIISRRLCCIRSCSALCGFGADCSENTVPLLMFLAA
jgi:hypothetical protein